jgi:hypothetical protein
MKPRDHRPESMRAFGSEATLWYSREHLSEMTLEQIEKGATAVRADLAQQDDWPRRHGVLLAGVIIVAAAMWWKAGLLAHFYFRQADFQILEQAAQPRQTWHYLTTPTSMHLGPAALGYAWLMAKASLYDWTLASIVTVALIGCAGLALLRLLRTMFGDHPAILGLLAIYLVSPLMLPELSWWSLTLGWLPLQLAGFMAVDAHVRHIRSGRWRYAAASAAWVGAGMMFSYLGALIPLLLFAITSGFFSDGSWVRAALRTLRASWKAWTIYALLLSGYAVLFATVLNKAASAGVKSPTASEATTFVSTLIRVGLVPGAIGGPWQWRSTGGYAIAVEMPVATQVGWIAAVVVVLASIWYRRRAWRAWAILAAAVLCGVIIPVIAWRSTSLDLAGSDVSNLATVAGVIVICVGLAFLPTTDERDSYRPRPDVRKVPALVALNLLGVVLVGSIWSAHAYAAATSGAGARSYIATARSALRRVPSNTEIVSTPVPSTVMATVFYGQASYTEQVLGPLAPAARLRWVPSPSGPVARLMIFDGEGRLWPAIVAGASIPPAPAGHACWHITSQPLHLGLLSTLYDWKWTAQVSHSGPAATLLVNFDGTWHTIHVPAGRQDAYFPAPGAGSSVTVEKLGPAPGGCVVGLTVGTPQASVYGRPLPATPVRG